MQAIQNCGLALITMVAGLIVDNHGYIWLELFFIFWLVVALVATIAIWLIDISGDGYLNMGVGQRDDFDKAKKEAEEEEARRKAELANPIRPKTARDIRKKYEIFAKFFKIIQNFFLSFLDFDFFKNNFVIFFVIL